MSRQVIRTLLGGGEGTAAVPLALAAAARIQERDWGDFLTDPTQLANGIRDLVDAVAPDGVPVCVDSVLLDQAANGSLVGGPHASAAIEATARLRQSLGDRTALVAVLPGPHRVSAAATHGLPAAVEAVNELGKQLLGAGVDLVLVRDEDSGGTDGVELGTLANIARFHQAMALSYAEPAAGLPMVTRVPLEEPSPRTGVVVTDGEVPRDADFTQLEDWVDEVH